MAGKQSASAPAASELRQKAQLILDRLQAAANHDERRRLRERGDIVVGDPDLLRVARHMIDKYGRRRHPLPG